ncbi:hypothetical protein CCAX7_55980 [Capsulimonas corticalis]|uniref:Uncharacterized protein n=1 Tax=Capsulimonas corticalis TaxID=2219043 RepID=A0A402D0P2_9BACT|nr:RICIN domain-containing protein [Capsulimonas corticalis]BDI33547.1 hypothetical protein CCAX7_55980 [Capsulimonas corticalis]
MATNTLSKILEFAGLRKPAKFDTAPTVPHAKPLVGLSITLLGAAAAFAPSTAYAQLNQSVTPYEAAASYNAFNQNYLWQATGNTFYNSELNSIGADDTGGWGQALTIVIAEDNYEVTRTPAALALVSNLLNTFETSSGTDWSGDGWNDDLGWMVNAYLRGYKITGNTTYLNIAIQNWNTVYNRGWDNALGGGIYELMDTKGDKECLSNDNIAWEGVWLYEITGDSTYLTKAENIYAWVRTHLFNPTNSNNAVGAPGSFSQGQHTADGSLENGDHAYNSGSFLIAANALYHITGNSMYYNDAVLDISHRMSVEPILSDGSESGGAQYAYLFVKGLSDFATDNHLWATYYPYLLANANQAWQERCSLNVTWNQWTAPTTPNSPPSDAMEMSSGAGIWQLLDVPQQSLIINKNSSLSMDLISGNTANNAPINQWSVSNYLDGAQHWMVIPTPNGHYALISSVTGMAATISAASKTNGAQLVDWPYSTGDASQQFDLVSMGSGWYNIKNVNSGLVLDVSGGSTANGGQIIQWTSGGAGAANQLWKLQSVVSFPGRYEIQSVSSSQVLDVSGSSTANSAPIVQLPYGGGTSQLWTFTPTSRGYYRIINVNSGQALNVAGGLFTNGAKTVQWPAGGGTNDEWLPSLNSDGTYTFYNLNSGLTLDNPGGSTQGAQFDQWITNNGSNQKFNLIAR